MIRPALACALFVSAVSIARAQVGVPLNGFPKWEERIYQEWTNRARCDPQVEMTACGSACSEAACYVPIPPLVWSLSHNRAARFHSDEMDARGFYAHASNCTLVSNISALYPGSCTGDAACACVGGTATCSPTCTSASQRVGLFGASFSGEAIVNTGNPNQGFYAFLYESNAPSTTCAFNGSNGHRWFILTLTGSVGAGVSAGYATMEFGSGGTIPKIPSGVHYPKQATSVDVWANWYDTAGPSQATVNIDGLTTSMTLRRGTQTNGAWSATLAGVGTGCHRYYFDFRDVSGVEVTYPASGSFGIGGTGCADWDASRAGGSGDANALTLAKSGATQIKLSWGASCNPADGDYEVYDGAIGTFTARTPVLCSTSGARSATLTPAAGSRYYLVVPTNGTIEGSYGTNDDGVQRAASASACRPQAFAACP
jgi:hypothetical protein